MAYGGAAYWALVGMTIATATANIVAVWMVARWRPGPLVRGVGTRDMVRFGTNVTATNLVNYFARRFDHLLLGWWWGATPLGLYTKANSLVETPLNRAPIPIGSVLIPSLSRLAGEPERYRDSYLRVLEMALVLMPASAFLIACASWLIPWLLGPRWGDAAPIFGALAVLGLVRPIEVSSLWLFITQNRVHEALRWSVAAALITAPPWSSGSAGADWGSD